MEAAGRPIGSAPPLKNTTRATSFVSRQSGVETMPAQSPASRPHAWLDQMVSFEAAPENVVVVQAELSNPHPLVAKAAKEARAEHSALLQSRERITNPPKRKPGQRWEPNWEALAKPSWTEYANRGYIMDPASSTLPLRLSIETTDRALRIWDALLKACKARGMRVTSGHRLAIVSVGRNDALEVGIRISERVDLTKSRVVGRTFEPAVRRGTGRLRLVLVHNSESRFEDSEDHPLEAQLNAVLVRIHRSIASQRSLKAQVLESRRQDEINAQANEHLRVEEAAAAQARAHELQRQQTAQAEESETRRQEMERERMLREEAAAWRDAQTIRAYVAQIGETDGTAIDEVSLKRREWLDWASDVADRLDPTALRRKTFEQ